MNNNRRKRLQEASEHLSAAQSIVEDVKDEEQDSYDNLPESLQMADKGDIMQQNVDTLEEVCDAIDEALNSLESIE